MGNTASSIPLILRDRRVYVAGHRGLVGQALCRRLDREGCEILGVARQDLDLRDQRATFEWFAAERPDIVFMAAGTVGGILANDNSPADFLYDNLMMAANVAEAARRCGVAKVMFLGSSCIYPKMTAQPIAETALLTGALEPTNEWYAIAKIAAIKLAQSYRRQYGCDFISVMPTNLYGPGDNWALTTSHVIPALMAKAHRAKILGEDNLTVWGSGRPRREFLFVDDLADACVFVMKEYSGEAHLNIGTGLDISIAEVARLIAEIVGFSGRILFDPTKPDGTPRKLLNVSRLQDLGWSATTGLRAGLDVTYRWYLAHEADRVAPAASTPTLLSFGI